MVLPVFKKRKEDINAIATIDTAIGNLKKALVRDTRKVGTNDWASRLQKVTKGQNNSPMEDYLEGQPPADVSTNTDLIDTLKEKNAKYIVFNKNASTKELVHLRKQVSFDLWKIGRKIHEGFQT